MKTILCTLLLLTGAMAALPSASAAPGNGNSWYGLCTAWEHNGKGRDNGNAENSTAFEALQEHAEDADHDSVEAFCDSVGRPGGGDGRGRSDQAPRGPPA